MFTINALFPTPVVTTNIERPLTNEELSIINYHKQKTYNNAGNITSLDTSIIDQFSSLKKFVYTGIQYYVDNVICPNDGVNFYITQSWINYTETGQHHHKHNHPNSIFSGVFYLNAKESVDKITFYSDQYSQITLGTKQWNPFNSSSWWFPVKTGDLIMFPSSLTHMVEQTQSKETRISLAFNVFARGNFGDEKQLTSLIL
jgi:uncharacterized protein (TIGR02466 family)